MYRSCLGWPARHEHFRGKDGRPLPKDESALLSLYGSLLQPLLKESGSDKSVETLVKELISRGVLSFDWEKFLPPLLTTQMIYDLMSCTYGQWCGWAPRHTKKTGLKPVVGSLTGYLSQWQTKDVLRVYHSIQPKRPRRGKFKDYDPLFPKETVRAFEDYLRATTERVLYDWAKESEKPKAKPKARRAFVGWPIGVPKDYTAFYREYRVFVERTLNRYIKPCPSQPIEDVKQHIWVKLIEAQVLEKFVNKARFRKIPSKMTATEAVEYLGVTWDQWMDLVRKDLNWLQPVEGALFSTTAVFTRDQIRNVEDSGIFPIQDAIPAEDMSKVFRGYLTSVIHNHFANYCRTRVRRFTKEMVLPEDNSRVTGTGVSTPLEGDLTHWEDALEDAGSTGPDLCADFAANVPSTMTMVGLNPYLSAEVEKINRAVPGHSQDVFDLIADGYTLREAISRVRSQIREMVREVATG